jgi:hypothetical protein
MLRITLNPRSPATFNRDQHSASIRAIMRADSFDDLLHRCNDYKVVSLEQVESKCKKDAPSRTANAIPRKMFARATQA